MGELKLFVLEDFLKNFIEFLFFLIVLGESLLVNENLGFGCDDGLLVKCKCFFCVIEWWFCVLFNKNFLFWLIVEGFLVDDVVFGVEELLLCCFVNGILLRGSSFKVVVCFLLI